METRKNGFTLVEILIVVVILGILAAIVIPQFSQATSETCVASTKSNVRMIRCQIELYKIQHDNLYPTSTSEAAFKLCLTSKTDVDGSINASGAYGPYMQSFPKNAVSDSDSVTIVAAVPAAGNVSATGGWFLNSSDGMVYAIHSLAALVTPATQY